MHFIKKNMWYLETALAFLETQDRTELEMRPSEPDEEENEPIPPGPGNTDAKGSRPRLGSPSGQREDPVIMEPDLVDPDVTNDHEIPMRHNKGMHVLLAQSDTEGLEINVKDAGDGNGGFAVLPADQLKLSEGTMGDDGKRGAGSGVLMERDDEETVTIPTAGHFANGSRRLNAR